MTDAKTAKRCADALAGFAEPIRIRIIDLLRTGPKYVGQLTKALNIHS